jgi:hypothetical protein
VGGHKRLFASFRNKVYYGIFNHVVASRVQRRYYFVLSPRTAACAKIQQDGFVQRYIAKIQPQPAKMPSVMVSLQVKTVLALINPKPNSMEIKR